MIGAELSNINHPEFGVVTIPLPIPKEQYDSCVELLESLEIGDASNQDCHLDELHCPWPVAESAGGHSGESGGTGLSGQAAGQFR